MLTLHHLLSGIIEHELAVAPGRRQRWFRKRELRKARLLEERALRTYDRCVVCSEEDAAALRRAVSERASDRIAVIPNGVDLSILRPTPLPREPRVLLPGTLAWGPNVDGAIWFCNQIWPQVRAAIPDAALTLAGRSPLKEILDLQRIPGVSVHADVASMVPYFESARVVVVPLRIGTGTRIKALEGMAAGRAVVGTSVGLEGIGVRHGEQALLADDEQSFCAAVVEVLRSSELAQALAQRGRDHVECNFGWDRVGARFLAMTARLLRGEENPQAPTRSASSAA
jgi:glycosyltransferase involved in cell wall biosynthesis